jgi:hypothetical protein
MYLLCTNIMVLCLLLFNYYYYKEKKEEIVMDETIGGQTLTNSFIMYKQTGVKFRRSLKCKDGYFQQNEPHSVTILGFRKIDGDDTCNLFVHLENRTLINFIGQVLYENVSLGEAVCISNSLWAVAVGHKQMAFTSTTESNNK